MAYNDYPEAASANAKRALEYRQKTGNPRQLANKENLSESTVRRMAAFERHRRNSKTPYSAGCGGLMWDAWGGNEGIDWAKRTVEKIDAEKLNNGI